MKEPRIAPSVHELPGLSNRRLISLLRRGPSAMMERTIIHILVVRRGVADEIIKKLFEIRFLAKR